VRCVNRDADGLIQVSGRLFATDGRYAAGRDFAATRGGFESSAPDVK